MNPFWSRFSREWPLGVLPWEQASTRLSLGTRESRQQQSHGHLPALLPCISLLGDLFKAVTCLSRVRAGMSRLQFTYPIKHWSHDGVSILHNIQRKGSCLVWTKCQSTPQLMAENADPCVDRTLCRRPTLSLANWLPTWLIKGQVIDWQWLIWE